jgi:hypothetical protein
MKIEKHKFKKYKIDPDKINLIFENFNECLEILEKNKIQFIVTGSVGLFLNTNKIYRNIGDIDFVLQKRPLLSEVYEFTSKGFKHIFETQEKINLRKNGVHVELFYKIPHLKDIKKIKYNNYMINYFSIEDIFLYKKITNHILKPKDKDDMDFYKKFIDNQEIMSA